MVNEWHTPEQLHDLQEDVIAQSSSMVQLRYPLEMLLAVDKGQHGHSDSLCYSSSSEGMDLGVHDPALTIV